eukprot:2184917-Rhodomonas_salina.1
MSGRCLGVFFFALLRGADCARPGLTRWRRCAGSRQHKETQEQLHAQRKATEDERKKVRPARRLLCAHVLCAHVLYAHVRTHRKPKGALRAWDALCLLSRCCCEDRRVCVCVCVCVSVCLCVCVCGLLSCCAGAVRCALSGRARAAQRSALITLSAVRFATQRNATQRNATQRNAWRGGAGARASRSAER